MKFVIALASLVLCISPASARCGLLTWSHDATCVGLFQPKPPREIASADAAWCRSLMRGSIHTCLATLARHRELERAIRPDGDDEFYY
jgi:hypothetical protein